MRPPCALATMILVVVFSLIGTAMAVSLVGTETTYKKSGMGVTIKVPSRTTRGDLMVMVMHRTDDFLPMYIDGWERIGECFKTNNGFNCAEKTDCIEQDINKWPKFSNARYCEEFKGGNQKRGGGGKTEGKGHDLAQAIFVKKVSCSSSPPSSFTFDLKSKKGNGKPAWIILTTLRGAKTTMPMVRDWSSNGVDENVHSVFPSVEGRTGDLLILSSSYDDYLDKNRFLPPKGMTLVNYIGANPGKDRDEAGWLFSEVLRMDGKTGVRTTTGKGGSANKDGMVALTIMPDGSSSCDGSPAPEQGPITTPALSELITPGKGPNPALPELITPGKGPNTPACRLSNYILQQCGGCKAWVFIFIDQTCDQYCQRSGLVCVSAAISSLIGCDSTTSVLCGTDFVHYGRWHAICECGEVFDR